jgi:hypothetical protein
MISFTRSAAAFYETGDPIIFLAPSKNASSDFRRRKSCLDVLRPRSKVLSHYPSQDGTLA